MKTYLVKTTFICDEGDYDYWEIKKFLPEPKIVKAENTQKAITAILANVIMKSADYSNVRFSEIEDDKLTFSADVNRLSERVNIIVEASEYCENSVIVAENGLPDYTFEGLSNYFNCNNAVAVTLYNNDKDQKMQYFFNTTDRQAALMSAVRNLIKENRFGKYFQIKSINHHTDSFALYGKGKVKIAVKDCTKRPSFRKGSSRWYDSLDLIIEASMPYYEENTTKLLKTSVYREYSWENVKNLLLEGLAVESENSLC